MGTPKDADRKVMLELTELLCKNSDKFLSGDTKLCLTTSSLGILATQFRRYSENAAHEETGGSGWGQKSKVKQAADLKKWQDSIKTLFDFVIKTKALKIISGSYTIKAPVKIGRFRSLQVLEVKKVPIHMVEGLSKLRGQLREVIISKSLQNLQDVLEICGGDRSPGLVWSHLKTVYLSFNSLTHLDNSLRFVPFIEVLDLSHNSLSQTEDYLQNVTDLVRINLGYNMLSAVPQFSHSNKGKLKTLVLRNNNLDSLEGIQELVSLEELDVTDNCIITHSQLQVLAGLNSLQVLCVTGNPLCYKANHRMLTMEHISWQADLVIFLLDGRRLTNDETSSLRQNQYKQRYANVDVIDAGSAARDNSAILQINGSGSTSVLFPSESPHMKKKKRGHRRIHSKERFPVITDMGESIEDSTTPKSKGASPTSSYVEDEDIQAQIEHDKKKIEIMREHYKDDWLKALSFEQKKDEGIGTSDRGKKEEKGMDEADGSVKIDRETPDNKKNTPEVQSVVKTEELSKENTSTGKENKPTSQTTETGPISPLSPISPISPELHIVDTTDIYSLRSTHHARRQRQTVQVETVEVHTTSEFTANRSDNEEQYGDESEPYIVIVPSEDMRQMFVTVNNRYIVEKDMNGAKLESLDLKCLKWIQKTEETLYGNDFIGGKIFTIITLDFDYVKKDMRQRKYAMEDDNDAHTFESLMLGHIKANKPVKEVMECLMCKHQFTKEEAMDRDGMLTCPKCLSKMVIKLDASQVQEDTVDGEPVTADVKEIEIDHPSPRLQRQKPVMAYNKSSHKDIPARSMGSKLQGVFGSAHLGSSGSLKEYVDRLIPDVDEPQHTSRHSLQQDIYGSSAGFNTNTEDVFESAKRGKDTMHDSATSNGSALHGSAMKPNTSWSDVRKSASQFATRGSVSSVESDITVLGTASRGSILKISESSHETLDSVLQLSNRSHASSLPVNNISGSNGHVTENRMRETQVQLQITPVGSPISSSVCSSMVSSVYENTLPGVADNTSGIEDQLGDNTHEGSLTSSSADSVSLRHSGAHEDKRSRRSTKHRTAVMYSQDLDAFSSQNSSLSGLDNSKASNRSGELSIYNTAELTQSQVPSFSNSVNISVNISDNSDEHTKPSIYDTVTSDVESDMSRDHDASKHLSLDSVRSHEQSVTTSVSSSPLKRSARSRSRDRQNRSAVYGDDLLESSTEQTTKSDLSDFPSDLSPIKRKSGSRRSFRKKNRSAICVESKDIEIPVPDESGSLDSSRSSALSFEVKAGNSEPETETGRSLADDSIKLLPWELEEKKTAGDKKDESLIHDEFVNIDHRIQLYLELRVFKADEICQCAIQCSIVQYMNVEEIPSLMVISTGRVLLFRVQGELDSNASSDWLKCYEDQPITELQYIDIGLGYQSLRLEFGTTCSSYTLLIADEGRCKKFLTLISGIVQSAAMHDNNKLEGISKSNHTTLANIEAVIQQGDHVDDNDAEAQTLVKYLIVKYMDEKEEAEEGKTRSLVVTTTDLILIAENHQWPLPRLQSPLSESIRGRQFTVIQREKINNIESLMFNEYNPTELRLTFFENSDINNAKPVWMISMVTTKGVKFLVDAIREPWEEEFGVSLDVTSTSFTDPEST